MNIKIDTEAKIVTVIEEIEVEELFNELQALLGDDFSRYMIVPSPIEYRPYAQPTQIDYPAIYRYNTGPSPTPTIT